MAFQVSPGVLVQERDLTRIIPAVSTSIGAFAGEFRKGPLDQITSISSEQELVSVFGKPDSNNFEAFFSAANFLSYSNALRVVRVQNTGLANAAVSGSAIAIKNTQDYQDNYGAGQASVGEWAARTAGVWGNGLKVSACYSATAFQEDAKTTLNDSAMAVGHTTVTLTSGTGFAVGDIVEFSASAAGTDYDGRKYKITNVATNDITFVRADTLQGGLHQVPANGANVRRLWEYHDIVSGAPGTSPYATSKSGVNDEMHIVVVDEDGNITGKTGEVIEVYDKVSKASDAKTPQGDSNYYRDVLYNQSAYIYNMDHHASGSNWGSAAAGITFTAVDTPKTDSLINGADGSAATAGERKTAYEKFEDSETVDVGLLIAGTLSLIHI